MKKSLLSLVLLSLVVLAGCKKQSSDYYQKLVYDIDYEYGVFLGASGKDKENIAQYHKAMIDIDEFSSNDIFYLKQNECDIYAYLSVGSLEKYRSYYEEYKDLTFLDYDNWPDERWIDVSDDGWKNLLISEAARFKLLGAKGIFMDNFDVYHIASEVYPGGEEFKEKIYQGCLDILFELSLLDLKLVINSGTTLLERMNDEGLPLLDSIDVYCQECVFSSIKDYNHNKFGKQSEEDHKYYLDMISMMCDYSEILLLEYSKSQSLVDEIVKYSKNNQYHYYISQSVNLN